MKFRLLGVVAATLMIAGCAETTPGPLSAERETIVTRTAIVETVDIETRQVLLRTDGNRMLSLVASPEVRNLPQLDSGDVVRFDYYEAVAARMANVGDSGEAVGAVIADRAPEGTKPGAAVGVVVNMVVEFVSYDPNTAIATFITPDGVVQNVVVKPEMRDFAAARKSGDRIDLTITQAVAVSIEETAG